MFLQNKIAEALHCTFNRCNLNEYISAVAVIVKHFDNAVYLSRNSA